MSSRAKARGAAALGQQPPTEARYGVTGQTPPQSQVARTEAEAKEAARKSEVECKPNLQDQKAGKRETKESIDISDVESKNPSPPLSVIDISGVYKQTVGRAEAVFWTILQSGDQVSATCPTHTPSVLSGVISGTEILIDSTLWPGLKGTVMDEKKITWNNGFSWSKQAPPADDASSKTEDEVGSVASEGEREISWSDASDGEELARSAAPVVDTSDKWQYPPQQYPQDAWTEAAGLTGVGKATQGEDGFAAYAMKACDLALGRMSPDVCERPLRPWQLRVAFFAHPQSVVSRLLVSHATGTGKTRTIVSIVEGLFHSNRATCLFFPTEAVKLNFYQELLRFPGSWRDYFCECEGIEDWRSLKTQVWPDHMLAKMNLAQVETHVGLSGLIRNGEILPNAREKWCADHPDVPMPMSPMRAYRYTTGGGAQAGLGKNGKFNPDRMDAVFKFGHQPGDKNPFGNKNLILDEAHNMLVPTKWWRALQNLRECLRSSQGSMVIMLTGSPVLKDPNDGRNFLRVVKGNGGHLLGDEGWVSVQDRGEGFARVVPAGVPDAPISTEMSALLVAKVRMSRALDAKFAEKLAEYKSDPDCLRKISSYGNMVPHSTWAFREPHLSNWRAHPRKFATKLHAVARSLGRANEKALVCISRPGGLEVFVELLRRRLQGTDREGTCPSIAVLTKVGGQTKAMIHNLSVPGKMLLEEPGVNAMLERFNSQERNLRGRDVGVLVLDTAQGAEGINILGVRRVDLVEIPDTWAEWRQQVGRAVRLQGHDGLPENECCVRVRLWVSERRSGEMAADGELLEKLKAQGAGLQVVQQEVKQWALDASVGGAKVADPVLSSGEGSEAFEVEGEIEESDPSSEEE